MFSNLKITRQIQEYFDNLHGIIAVSEMVKADAEKLIGKEVPVKVVYPFIHRERFTWLRPTLKVTT